MKFAIIGAGMAGLACVDALCEAGHSAVLFDKGRGPGGRMSTRRLPTPQGDVSLDHGAQYFTARDPAFVRLVKGWSAHGIAAPWPNAGVDAWVGVPGMNSAIRHMAAGHQVIWGHQVASVTRVNERWWLDGPAGQSGPFDAVVLAIPAEQAAPILSLHDFEMARAALMARSQPCWTGMFVFDRPLDGVPDVVRDAGLITWAARNSAKPGRTGPEAWVVQASATWSSAQLECNQEYVANQLLSALAAVAGRDLPAPIAASAHRWRYALSAGTGEGAMWNPALKLGACGDWLLGPRVECAWLSGRILAGACIGSARGAEAADTSASSLAKPLSFYA